VAKAVDVVDHSGLDYRLHAMGTEVEGELGQLLDLLKRAIDAVSADCERVSVSAKIDVRKGRSGTLASSRAWMGPMARASACTTGTGGCSTCTSVTCRIRASPTWWRRSARPPRLPQVNATGAWRSGGPNVTVPGG
jgi:uncharacterized protein YqgV (UPF0045/DUF77 family)